METIPQVWNRLVPNYRSRTYRHLVVGFQWEEKYADQITRISPKRALNRYESYINEEELSRALSIWNRKKECSIRFGVGKKGKGNFGSRGDFCLVGGSLKGKNLTLMYRSLELIGGFAYDLTLIDEIERYLGMTFKNIHLMCAHAHVFALKKNSNENLYPKLKEIFSESD